jgi:hypothetical protein
MNSILSATVVHLAGQRMQASCFMYPPICRLLTNFEILRPVCGV